MTLTRRRAVALAATWTLALTSAPATIAVAQQARVVTPPDATRVVAPCRSGPGRISITVLPRGEGSYRVTVLARRLRNDDSQWRAKLLAFTRNGEEVATTFRRRPVDRAWSFSTDVRFDNAEAASFLVGARRLREDGSSDDDCLVGNSPGRPEGGFAPCG